MERDSLKSYENLCKIFEMRIKLDNEKRLDTPDDVLINYEKYCKKIDTIYNDDFQREIKPLISPEVTIEKEEERLKKLINLLEERLEKREKLENNFYMITGTYIKGLQLVVSESELNEKKDRLDIITKYLSTKNEIDNITVSIAKLKNSLEKEEETKEEYKTKNKIMEDELYSSFIDILKEINFNVNEEEIDKELVTVLEKVKETKETLEVTKESVNSLLYGGLDEDYSSYIEDAEKSYYTWKNRELLLRIYELVIKFEDEFTLIDDKREKIFDLLKKRKALRINLHIDNEDEFTSFEELLDKQMNTLSDEKEILENVVNYTNRIKFKEERLDELEEDNNSVEVLSILREYGLIDTYDSKEEDIPEEIEEEIPKEIELPFINENIPQEEKVVKEVIDPYRIVEVIDYPKTLNIGLARLKGESVRDKVNKKLNPEKVETTFTDISLNLGKKEEKIPEEKVSTPVWELPKVENISNIKEENTPKEEPGPWYEIKPIPQVKEETNNELPDMNIPISNNNFWVTASDSKLSTNEFPNINIPINNSFTSSKDNFGFPDLKG